MPAQRIDTPDGISWHIETFRSSSNSSKAQAQEYIVLIPSGEGDCHNLTTVAKLLSSNPAYHVLTFDMPGFSRTSAPVSAYTNVAPKLLADQIMGLLDKLDIQRASFFGCSSGGSATLALCELYPSRVKCGIAHEVPFELPPILKDLKELQDDKEITTACQEIFSKGFIEQDVNDGTKKWEELGPEYHARLAKNYPVWVRGYLSIVDYPPPSPQALQQRPLFWTVGALNPGAKQGGGAWGSNFRVAKEAGLKVNVERLQCLHFPSVTVPKELSEWIGECVERVED